MDDGRNQIEPLDTPDLREPLDQAGVAALYAAHAEELRRFVHGIVRDAELARDVLQITFVKAIEQAPGVRAESRKAWLFRVALNEALMARRRAAVGVKVQQHLAANWSEPTQNPDDALIRSETVEAVRQAISRLAPEQRQVLLARIDEEKTFARIAAEQGLPLGTVLTRMRLALKHLRRSLKPREGSDGVGQSP